MKLAATSAIALSAALVSTACHTERMPYLVDGSTYQTMFSSLDTMMELAGMPDTIENIPGRFKVEQDIRILAKRYGDGDLSYTARNALVAREIDGMSIDQVHERAGVVYLFLVAKRRQQDIDFERAREDDPACQDHVDLHRKRADQLIAMSFAEYEQEHGDFVSSSGGGGGFRRGLGRNNFTSIMKRSYSGRSF